MPAPIFFSMETEESFMLSLFSGAYVFKLQSALNIDATSAEAIFTIARSNKDLTDVDDNQMENIPTYGELLEILEKTYLTEFLIGMAINGYPISERIERYLIVNEEKNSAYIEIKCIYTTYPNNSVYKDYFEIYARSTTREVSVGNGTTMDWSRQISQCVSRPFYMADIDLVVKSKTNRPAIRFTSRNVDMAKFYFAFVDPVIQTMTSYAVNGEVGETSLQMYDYLRFSIDMNIKYNTKQMIIHLTAKPNLVLKHKLYWTTPSSFTIECPECDNYADQNMIGRDECQEIIGTACRDLIPIVFCVPKRIIQYGIPGCHFEYSDSWETDTQMYTNPIIVPFGLDSKCDTNPIFYYVYDNEIPPNECEIQDYEFTNHNYKVKTVIKEFSSPNDVLVFGNTDEKYGIIAGIVEVNFDEYIDYRSFRGPMIVQIDDKDNIDKNSKKVLNVLQIARICKNTGLPLPKSFYLKPYQSFPYSRSYLIIAECTLDQIQNKVPAKSSNSLSNTPQKDIINMDNVPKKKRGIFNIFRSGK